MLMKSILFFLFLPVLLCAQKNMDSSIYLQEHDECQGAQWIDEEIWYHEDNHSATLSDEKNRPAPYPATCIPTYENDLWYRFETEGMFEYEITIVHRYCNSPSGLQALLIETPDCNPKHFNVISCSSQKLADTIKLVFVSKENKSTYLLYIDGYGGAKCVYELQLKRQQGALSNPKNLSYNRFYKEELPCDPYPLQVEVQFENNIPKIQWTDPDPESAEFYVLERILEPGSFKRLSILKTEKIAAGYQADYAIIDYESTYKNDEAFSYRVLRYNAEGKISCSDPIQGKARVQKDFLVSEPYLSNTKGIYKVNYILFKKQPYKISILDKDFQVLKEKSLSNTEKGEHTSSLDLSTYPPGVYYFRLSSATDYFLKKIEKWD